MPKKAYEDRDKVHKSAINFAVSPIEKEMIRKAAEAIGMTMSGYIRYRLFVKEAK